LETAAERIVGMRVDELSGIEPFQGDV